MNCCRCDNTDNAVKWCPICGHFLCTACRWDLGGRTYDALKQHLLKIPPKFCNHSKGD